MAEDVLKIRFRVGYNTQFGQNLVLQGTSSIFQKHALGDHKGVQMQYRPGAKWEAELAVPVSEVTSGLKYRYLFVHASGKGEAEGGGYRTLKLSAEDASKVAAVQVRDKWRLASDPMTIFSTSAFRKVIFGRAPEKPKPAPLIPVGPSGRTGAWVRVQIECARVEAKHKVYVCGSSDALGNWDASKAVALTCDADTCIWHLDLLLSPDSLPLSYKFVIGDEEQKELVWEDGPNRMMSLESATGSLPPSTSLGIAVDRMDLESTASSAAAVKPAATALAQVKLADGVPNGVPHGVPSPPSPPPSPPPQLLLYTDDYFRFGTAWKGAGVAIPVFSLRSRTSLGVGEFLDLKPLVDWCAATGLQLIQLLPVNDTCVTGTWLDSYPYSSVSVCALHPMYVSVSAIGKLPAGMQAEIDEQRAKLDLPLVDYEAMMAVKTRLLERLYEAHKEAFGSCREAQAWVQENKAWLLPYAVFCFFRDLLKCSEFTGWGKRSSMSTADMEEFAAPTSPFYDLIARHVWLQYHLFKQLREVALYAEGKRVALKGDLPIGVNKYCADTWVNRRLFRMDTQTGAPPDFFAVNGQNWGFPTYNWEEMRKDGYAWWRTRLAQLQHFFHAYRIDHILGFFRIWEIPDCCVTGLLGRFRPAVPIRKWELEKGNIWDMCRLTEPYVRRHLLEAVFKHETDSIISRFFDPLPQGAYRFRSHVDTERKIETALALEDTASDAQRNANETLKSQLFSFVANVILLTDPQEADGYHFRITMMTTTSYMELPGPWKDFLYKLYVNYFYERQDALWRDKALDKLPMMRDSSDMLVCGEDLGMVPECVSGTLNTLSILGLRIQRMSSDPKKPFGEPWTYPYLTVCTPSCHDMSTLRGWWEEDRQKTQLFYNTVLRMQGHAPHACEPYVVEAVIKQHLDSPSVLAIFPLQDLFGLRPELRRQDVKAEQINEPANPKHYWRYRIHITLEELCANNDFAEQLQHMVRQARRGVAY